MSRFQVPTFAIEYFVSKLHVGVSNVAVIRDIRRRLTPDKATKRQRKLIYRHALRCHARNRSLYQSVMSGRFSSGSFSSRRSGRY